MGEPWRHETVRANGLSFHCAVAGEGPLLLLLHGFPQFWYAWRNQIPALAKRFKVVAPDLRGYGDTDKPTGVAAYRLDALLDDLAGLIRAFGAARASIVGHDWGGALTWLAAMRRPELVERIAVLNCPHPAVFTRKILRPPQLWRSWYIFFFQLPWLPERLLLRDEGREFVKLFRASAAKPEAFTDDDLRAYREAALKPGAMTAALNYYRASFRDVAGRRALADPPRIAAPTLLVWGERDQALGVELTEALEPLFSGPFTLRRVPDASHWIQEEQPDQVNALLLDFLGA